MPDPFRKVRPGEPVEFGATAWNAMLDAAVAEQRRKRVAQTALEQTRNAGICRVLNATGSDLPRASVVALDAPIFQPIDGAEATNAFLREPAFRGVTPDIASHRGRFGVLLEPCLDGQVARAYVSGVCQVKIDVLDQAHRFADITDAETGHLTSCDGGGARILWCEGDAEAYGYGSGYEYDLGVQWAMVLLGPTLGGRIAMTQSGGITKRIGSTLGKGMVTWYRLAFDGVDVTIESTGTEGMIFNMAAGDDGAVDANTYVLAKVIDGIPVVDWEECPGDYY